MSILKTWYDGDIYNKQIELGFFECDYNKKIKLSSILAIASDTAGKDYTERGISHKKMMEAKEVMLLARYHVHINRSPLVDEIITVRTWEKGIMDGLVLRDFEFIDSNQSVCIVISSSWIVVNPYTKKFIKPKNFQCKKFGLSDIDTGCEICRRIILSNKNMEYFGEHVVEYSELDGNGHLNNANYGNIIFDSIKKKDIDSNFTDIYINYIKEAKAEEVMKLYICKEEDSIYIEGKVEDKTSFICEMK